MRTSHIFLASFSLLALAGCSQGTAMTLDDHMRNPLYAQRYWDELVDRMTNMQIHNDPALKDAAYAADVDKIKHDALKASQDNRLLFREGVQGSFLSMKEETNGLALLLNGTLYLDTTFVSYPGPDLRIYLTEAVDPRDVEFPDETSLDLGKIQNLYGAQEYALPEENKLTKYRTAVLWDKELKRLYAFAQLSL